MTMNGNPDTADALCGATNSVTTDIVDTHSQIGSFIYYGLAQSKYSIVRRTAVGLLSSYSQRDDGEFHWQQEWRCRVSQLATIQGVPYTGGVFLTLHSRRAWAFMHCCKSDNIGTRGPYILYRVQVLSNRSTINGCVF